MGKKMRLWRYLSLGTVASAFLFSASLATAAKYQDPEDFALAFDPSDGTALSVTVDGAPVGITKYVVTYVANPVAADTTTLSNADQPYGYQRMAIFVPDNLAADQDAAIIFAVNNGGWMKSELGSRGFSIEDGGSYVSNTNTDRTGAALAAGYIFVDVGTRSRTAVGADGSWIGKAPSVVVDAKAAIRYLRLNDAVIPGSSEKIVITGTSGGGGLSTAIAASGNSADYYPYLNEIGAAGIDSHKKKLTSTLKDDVFAVIAYCPITDLGNADIAYEWQFGPVRELNDYLAGPGGGRKAGAWVLDTLPAYMLDISNEMALEYPDYLASLGLKMSPRKRLTVETMPEAIMAYAKASIEKALEDGKNVPNLGEAWDATTWPSYAPDYAPESLTSYVNDWFSYDAVGTVTVHSYENFLKYVKATTDLKGAPSFDVTGTSEVGASVGKGETNLFGAADVAYSNFMAWAWNNNNVAGDGSGLDDTGLFWNQYIGGSELEKQIKLINPLPYLISRKDGDSAPYWYVRHGLRDRDTSFAVEMELFYAIDNDPSVLDVNTALAYDTGHAGNYDVLEAYEWLADILADEALPGHREKSKHGQKKGHRK